MRGETGSIFGTWLYLLGPAMAARFVVMTGWMDVVLGNWYVGVGGIRVVWRSGSRENIAMSDVGGESDVDVVSLFVG